MARRLTIWLIGIAWAIAVVLVFLQAGWISLRHLYWEGRFTLGNWTWALLANPAAWLWFTAILSGIWCAFQGLFGAVGAVVDFSAEPKFRRRLGASATILIVNVLLIVGSWVLAWGSFPFNPQGDQLYIRFFPFIPWPTRPF
jgi:hypothetical protein